MTGKKIVGRVPFDDDAFPSEAASYRKLLAEMDAPPPGANVKEWRRRRDVSMKKISKQVERAVDAEVYRRAYARGAAARAALGAKLSEAAAFVRDGGVKACMSRAVAAVKSREVVTAVYAFAFVAAFAAVDFFALTPRNGVFHAAVGAYVGAVLVAPFAKHVAEEGCFICPLFVLIPKYLFVVPFAVWGIPASAAGPFPFSDVVASVTVAVLATFLYWPVKMLQEFLDA